jgi:hypothetical protein
VVRDDAAMAKYKLDPITAADIGEYAADQSDFAFECDVVRLLADLHVPKEHSGTYEDPVTGKPASLIFAR